MAEQTLAEMIKESILGSNNQFREHAVDKRTSISCLYNMKVLLEVSEKRNLLDIPTRLFLEKIYEQDVDAFEKQYYPVYRTFKQICKKMLNTAHTCIHSLEEVMP